MSQNETVQIEVRRIRRMLKQIHSMADHASLTGSMTGGAPEVIDMYNRILDYLKEQGVMTSPLFAKLPTDAPFERVGVAARLLEGYLTEEPANFDIRVAMPPNLDELKDIGRTIRDNLPDFIRRKMETKLDKLERTEAEAQARHADYEARAAEYEGRVAEYESKITDYEAKLAQAQATGTPPPPPPTPPTPPILPDAWEPVIASSEPSAMRSGEEMPKPVVF